MNTGAPTADETLLAGDFARLLDDLLSLARPRASSPDPRRVIIVSGGLYDFATIVRDPQNPQPQRALDEFPIRFRRVTIKAQDGARVVFKNVQLQIDLDTVEDILIENIAFRTDIQFRDGKPASPRDAISIASRGVLTPPKPEPRSSVKVNISHCSFQGYFDIAIDTSVSAARPRLVATVDRCLFYDDQPGHPLTPIIESKYPFANRGAINIAGDPNALFTISNNVYINIWRRCPRVANGNRAFIYNNLLFRWGIGNDETGDANGANEWFAIATDNSGKAVIWAIRFILYVLKTQGRKTISIGPDTKVDLGAPSVQTGITAEGNPIFSLDTTNEFDGSDGKLPSPEGLPPTSSRIKTINVDSWYGGSAPVPIPTNSVNWRQLVLTAGPANFDRPDVKDDLLALL